MTQHLLSASTSIDVCRTCQEPALSKAEWAGIEMYAVCESGIECGTTIT